MSSGDYIHCTLCDCKVMYRADFYGDLTEDIQIKALYTECFLKNEIIVIQRPIESIYRQ